MGTEPLALLPNELAATLARLAPETVLCLHQCEFDVAEALPAGLLLVLADLGQLKPLQQRIPSCDEHPCPARNRCSYVADFAPKSNARRGGRKFRLATGPPAPEAFRAFLDRALPTHPVARWLAKCYAERSSWTVPELAAAWYWAARRQAEVELVETSSPASGEVEFDGSRRRLAACVALLVGLGYLRWTREGLELRLARQWW